MKLSDLVGIVAGVTALQRATVFAYGRFAREAGYISQTGRGRGGATMSTRDAANLLIAICGTGVTREAASAIQTFRPMRGFLLVHNKCVAPLVMGWLNIVGLKSTKAGGELDCDLGGFLEFLIEEGGSGNLSRVLLSCPKLVEEKRQTVGKRSYGSSRFDLVFDRSEPLVTLNYSYDRGLLFQIAFHPADLKFM